MHGTERFHQDAGAPGPSPADITGVVLAGGLSRRMAIPQSGQPSGPARAKPNPQTDPDSPPETPDKGLMPFEGQPLASWVIERLQAQVGRVVINANRHLEHWTKFGWPVLADHRTGFAGPLAGLETALREAQTDWVLTVPCDGPFFPRNLVERLGAAAMRAEAQIASAATTSQAQPVYMLVRRDALSSLSAFLDAGGRRIDAWTTTLPHVTVIFDDERAFANLNTPEEFTAAQRSNESTGHA